MTSTTTPDRITAEATFATRYIGGDEGYDAHPETPQTFNLFATFPAGTTPDEAAEWVAQFPKSLRIRLTTLTRPADGSYRNGSEVVPAAAIHASLLADGVNGGRNETGIARARKALADPRLAAEWTANCVNSYATAADFLAAAGA